MLSNQQLRIVDVIEKSGIVTELEQKASDKHIPRRAECIAELEKIPADRVKILPPLATAYQTATVEVEKAQAALQAASGRQLFASIQLQSAQYSLELRESAARDELKRLAPAVLGEAFRTASHLDWMARMAVLIRERVTETWSGKPSKETTSNLADVIAVRDRIKAILTEVENMAYSAIGAADATVRCDALILEAVGLVKPLLKDREELHRTLANTSFEKSAA